MDRPLFCFCGKQFSNRKAMGGHKKVHSLRLRRMDDPGKRITRSSLMNPDRNNLGGGVAAAVGSPICAGPGQIASAVKGDTDMPLKKRKLVMDDAEKNSESTPPPPPSYFCSICGVCFQSRRALSSHNGHHTKAARNKIPIIILDDSSSSSDDDYNDKDYDVNEDEDDEEEDSEAAKRAAVKCPYNCERVFRSVKSLGGHKRYCINRAAAVLNADRADHGGEAAAAKDRNGGGNNNRLAFDLNEIPDLDD